MNRGGLYQCTIEFFDFLCAVEIVVKGMMTRGNEESMKKGFASTAYQKVVTNEDVLFFWSLLCANIENELMDPLLDRIVRSYISLRGHAFAAQWIEHHKQKTKKTVDKSRSFRSRLQTLTN